MHRRKAILCILLLFPITALTAPVSAAGLTDSGTVDTLDGRGIFWTLTNNNNVLYINSDGDVIYYSVDKGIHTEMWNTSLSVDVKCVRIDGNAQWLAVGHSSGALLISMSDLSISENISTPAAVTSIDFDIDGDLWLGHTAEPRRAVEYRGNTTTAVETDQHYGGVKDLKVLSDGTIITAGNDKRIYIFDPAEQTTTTLTESNSIESMSVSDNEIYLFLTTSAGELIRYLTSDWTADTLQVGGVTTTLTYSALSGNNSELYVGSTSFQKVWVIDTASMTIVDELTSTGTTIGAIRGGRGELYVISALMPNSLVRLFDIDSDDDGSVDSQDEFPYDPTQTSDADGDGHGDNAEGNNGDHFPDNPTQWDDADGDGWGDNPNGTDYDAFPDNYQQHADSDGDGYGDNPNGEGADEFPDDATQWVDTDNDGRGDNVNGTNGDSCPMVNGFSSNDRYGCPDYDGDGWSDPDANWHFDYVQCNAEQINCADAFPNERTQWSDRDGDGYGDNGTGVQGDSCWTLFGNSTKIVERIINSGGSTTWTTTAAYGCDDFDGDGYADYGDDFHMNATEFVDIDYDGSGHNSDYNDSNPAIQTFEQHCLINLDDDQGDCLAIRDVEYQEYRNTTTAAGDDPLGYIYWRTEQQGSETGADSKSTFDSAIEDVVTYGGFGFVGLTAAILLVSGIITMLRKRKAAKAFGNIKGFDPREAMEELTAEESGEAFTASGGVTDQEMWEDDIPDIELGSAGDADTVAEDDDDKELVELGDDTATLAEDASLEEMAGSTSDTSEAAALEVPEDDDDDSDDGETTKSDAQPAAQAPPEAPPLPASGLPAGWTEEQWRWYGAQWLKDNEDN